MRFREQKPEDLERARAKVQEWRAENPEGTAEEMLAALAGQFSKDYAPVLRSVLFRIEMDGAEIARDQHHRRRGGPVTRRAAAACAGVPNGYGFQSPAPSSPRCCGGRGARKPRPPKTGR